MGLRRDGGVVRPSGRGQSALLGLVLLIGMVAAASVGMLLVAGDMMDNTQQQSENERVEQSFIELSQQMSTVSANQDTSRSIEFDVANSGAVTRTGTGNITLKADNLSAPIELPMGSIEYEADDGSIVAYQAGGVWRETGNQTQMISQPEISYNAEDETLLLPVTTVSGERELSSGEVNIAYAGTDPVQNATLVQNSTVTLEITSKYYRGWALYFEEEVGDASVENVTQLKDDKGYVEVKLGLHDLEGAFDSDVNVPDEDNVETQGNDAFDDVDEDQSMPVLDGTIDDLVDEENTSENRDWADDPDDNPLVVDRNSGPYGNGTFENGTYFADEVDVDSGQVTFDLSDGDATLIVDGDIDVDGSFNVTNAKESDHELKIYSTEDVTVGGDMCVDPCTTDDVDAKHLQVYGTSEMLFTLEQGGAYFEGIIYAPGGDAGDFTDADHTSDAKACKNEQICLHLSGTDFDGAIVSTSVGAQSSGGDFEHDPDLDGFEPDIYPDGYAPRQDITYLNVAVHTLDVKNK